VSSSPVNAVGVRTSSAVDQRLLVDLEDHHSGQGVGLVRWWRGVGEHRSIVPHGAGVSAESGLATFRGPEGLWEGHRVEDVCTPEAFARDPALVHRFYDARRARLGEVEPNGAHVALARLDAEWPGEYLIVTQNVDDLHERAGSKRLLHMHGELTSGWCLACNNRFPWDGPMDSFSRCPTCAMPGMIDASTPAKTPASVEDATEVCAFNPPGSPALSTPAGRPRP